MYTYQYPRAALTTDAIVFVRKKETTFVLLIQRGSEPFINRWALPGGFINMNETLEEACKRELEEETGLKVERMAQFKTYDAIDRDPRHRTISVIYYAELKDIQPVTGNDDAAQAQWFSLDSLPQLAFDHQLILEDFSKILTN
jgi:8-oxo-dGTP diphosphatase